MIYKPSGRTRIESCKNNTSLNTDRFTRSSSVCFCFCFCHHHQVRRCARLMLTVLANYHHYIDCKYIQTLSIFRSPDMNLEPPVRPPRDRYCGSARPFVLFRAYLSLSLSLATGALFYLTCSCLSSLQVARSPAVVGSCNF